MQLVGTEGKAQFPEVPTPARVQWKPETSQQVRTQTRMERKTFNYGFLWRSERPSQDYGVTVWGKPIHSAYLAKKRGKGQENTQNLSASFGLNSHWLIKCTYRLLFCKVFQNKIFFIYAKKEKKSTFLSQFWCVYCMMFLKKSGFIDELTNGGVHRAGTKKGEEEGEIVPVHF